MYEYKPKEFLEKEYNPYDSELFVEDNEYTRQFSVKKHFFSKAIFSEDLLLNSLTYGNWTNKEKNVAPGLYSFSQKEPIYKFEEGLTNIDEWYSRHTIPQKLGYIPKNNNTTYRDFELIKSVNYIVFPSSLVKIEPMTFARWKNLTAILFIPKNWGAGFIPTEIGSDAFRETNLKYVYYEHNQSFYIHESSFHHARQKDISTLKKQGREKEAIELNCKKDVTFRQWG